MCAALLKMKKRATISFTRSRDCASCTHLCMLQYSANMVVMGYYMCLPSFEGCGHVRHCQECVRLAPCFDLVELIVALLCITDSAAHACSLRNLTDICNSIVWPYLQSIEACTSVCS